MGPSGDGKSTVLEAIALLFGRDRLVRTLTEHDLYGSDPQASDRIRIIGAVAGFGSNAAADHSQWVSDRRGVPKRLTRSTEQLPEPQTQDDALSVQLGFCALFDRSELYVETIRYFHDDDAVIQTIPPRLITENRLVRGSRVPHVGPASVVQFRVFEGKSGGQRRS